MKVYELAKKLGVKSVFLMDKIRKEWKLPIKSHMVSLDPHIVKDIENKFKKEQTSDKPSVDKKVKRVRKVSSVKASESAGLASKPVKAPAKIIRRSKTEEPLPQEQMASSPPLVTQNRESDLKQSKESPQSTEVKKSQNVELTTSTPSTSQGPGLEAPSWKKAEDPAKKTVRKPMTEKEIELKFQAADFRKREIIFQPKKKRTVLSGDLKKTQITKPKSHKRVVKIYGEISIDDLAKNLQVKKQKLIRKLKSESIDTKQALDFDTASLISSEFGFEVKNVKKSESELVKEARQEIENQDVKTSLKPPVVTIMGHVDHGKTTLLDTIRKSKVVDTEQGGITQHIGAYSVPFSDSFITFIDTPGHAAFTKMRARGAQVTDIVILVVSAADGVMPQTKEAISHAKQAGIPIIVAVNKMDLEGANLDKIKQDLAKEEVVSEEWGGDVSFIPISALKQQGIKELLEQIQLVAEIQELKCQPDSLARGMVIEASIEKGRGNVVTVIIQDGTLKSGQTLLAGRAMGRSKQLKDDQGNLLKQATPGQPVQLVGFDELPEVGDTFYVVKNEKTAKSIISQRKQENQQAKTPQLSVEDLLEKVHGDKSEKELNLIVKSDVSGSLEALKQALEAIKGEKVSLKIIHAGTGAVTESDVLLASTVSAYILGFNVRPDNKAQKMAQSRTVEIRTYSIIYELLDDVKNLMLGLLTPESVDEDQGYAEVKEIFNISKLGTIAGCQVAEGLVQRNNFVRVVRDGKIVFTGKLKDLRRFKDTVKEVKQGFECGILLENFNDIKPQDRLEFYTKKEIKQTEL